MSFAACPRRWIDGYVGPESKAKSNGNLVDTLLLMPDKFSEAYVECPATYEATGMRCPICKTVTDAKTCRACKCDREPVKITKDWDWTATVCKEFREANKGKEPVKSDVMIEARSAVKVMKDDALLDQLLLESARQVMVVGEYKDKVTGLTIPVKALLDIAPSKNSQFGRMLLDFKTTRCAAMRAWQRDCFQYGYAAQAAFHTDLYVAATDEDRCTWGHIVQENVPPFHVEKRILSSEFVDLGRGQYLSALALYCQCLSTGRWPGYYAQTTIESWDLVTPEGWMVMATDTRPSFNEHLSIESQSNEIQDDINP